MTVVLLFIVQISVAQARPQPWLRNWLLRHNHYCLVQIIDHEDGNYDPERVGGGYGIPQAVPGNKMASAGSNWATNPWTQIRWMIGYVNGKYGGECNAWAYWQVHSNY